MRIGVYGGTFNPIHSGHISLAEQLYKQFSLDKIIFIPTDIPPHKQVVSMASPQDRLTLCEIALKDYPDFFVSDTELKRGGKSYTVDTLTDLQNEFPDDELFLIVGSDMLFTFDEWKEYRTILDKAVILAGARKPKEYDMLQKKAKKLCEDGGRIFVFQNEVVPVSSTEVRMRIAQGADCGDFLPSSVELYIKQHGLYCDIDDMINEIKAIVSEEVSQSRFYHTQCVVKEAVRLAKIRKVDLKQAEIAALLHDILKNRSNQSLLQMMSEYGIILSETEQKSPALWHAIAAPDYCRTQLGIVDERVLAAIRYHTTGRAGMSELEKIIYLADAVSEDRDYPDADRLRELATDNFDVALSESFAALLTHLISQRCLLHPDTVAAFNQLILKNTEDSL